MTKKTASEAKIIKALTEVDKLIPTENSEAAKEEQKRQAFLAQAERDRLEREAPSTMTTAIEGLSNYTEVFRNGQFTYQDTMHFHRSRLIEKMLDQLNWSKDQAVKYSDKQRTRVNLARQRFNGDEISTTQLKGAIAEAQSASLNAEMLQSMYDDLQKVYICDNDEYHTPYGMKQQSNVPTSENAADIPEDMAKQLKAMGLDGPTDIVANTQGTGEAGFTKTG